MQRQSTIDDKRVVKPAKVEQSLDKQRPLGPQSDTAQVLHLQQQVGNKAVQRLLAQRSSEDGFDLDADTTGRINQARGGGQALDNTVQKQMSQSMGYDFSGVRVHTSPESDSLNQQLSAKAFTTGQDVFFKQGEYNPGSGSGQELIAHELTHVVQQSTGQVPSGGSGMRVTAAGDAYEQEADAMAQQVTSAGTDVQLQRDNTVQRVEEEEPPVQMQRDQTVQRAESLEEEEPPVQMQRDNTVQRVEEEEPPVQMQRDITVQRAESLEEEEPPVQMQRDNAVQRMEEEEPPVQMQRDQTVQRAESLEEEEPPVQMQRVQRASEEDEMVV